MRDRFVTLIVDFCNLCGVDDAMGVVRGGPVETDGVLFSLVHSEKIDPRLLLIYGDIGEPAPRGDARAYAALLSRNFFLSAGRGPVFSIAPDTGRIALVQSECLAELTADLLADRLGSLAAQAHAWRDDPLPSQEASQPAGGAHRRFGPLNKRPLHHR